MTTLINAAVNPLVGILRRSRVLESDLDYHVVRASMVIMFFFFGYQKWWAYEAERLVPFISNGPLIWWLYPLFGHQGASWFLGVSEWTFGSLLFAGFWDSGSVWSAPSARPRPSSRQSRSSRSCLTAGIRWPDFRRRRATFPSC